jgi:8-oxo-dGTP pyrophosphatase MutT (NUDIX family)
MKKRRIQLNIPLKSLAAGERVRKQTGVIPYAYDKKGVLHILLISSRHAGNWGIPKGKKEKDLGKKESAEVEAWEEAGVDGDVTFNLGQYSYRKGSTGVAQKVTVYGLKVENMYKKFPEKDMRVRKWFEAKDALKKLNAKLRPFLSHLIVNLDNE